MRLSAGTRAIALASVAALVFACGGTGNTTASSKPTASNLKVALILTESLTTSNLGKAAAVGLQRIKKEFGLNVAVSDNQSPADMRPTLRDYAQRGYDLVVCQGASLQAPALEVASAFPNTKFVVVNGNKAQEPNAAAIDFVWEQGGFLAGAVAGLATKSNKVAGIGSIHIPPIDRLLNGFQQGVAYTNSKADVSLAYSGTFTDPAANKQTTLVQIAKGVDVVFTVATGGDPGVFQATDEKGILGIGYGTDESSLGPKSVATSLIVDYGTTIYDVVKLYINKQFAAKVYVYGLKDNVFGMAPYQHLPADVLSKAKDVVSKAEQGKTDIKVASS